MSPYVENKMNDCRRQLENLKSQISGEKYQYVEKLRILKLEQKKIEARMQENKRKAMNQKDPIALIILLVITVAVVEIITPDLTTITLTALQESKINLNRIINK